MAGIKINNLPEVDGILSNDDFIVSRGVSTKKITGETLFNNFSGVKNAINYGGGVDVYKGSTSSSGSIGTTLQFNTLSGSGGINFTTNGSLVVCSLSDLGINNSKYNELSITGDKIANSTITGDKIFAGSITPEKQSGTLCDVKTRTAVQSWAKNTIFPITGLSAIVTPPTTSSKVMLVGTLCVGAVNCGISLRRTINGTHTFLARGDDTGNAITEVTFSITRNSGDYNTATIPINYIDSPNTTQQVTYSIVLYNTDTKNAAYLNRGVNETNATTSFRSISQFSAIVLP